MENATFEPGKDRYFVSYYNYAGYESGVEELVATAQTDLKLHVGLPRQRPHEEYRKALGEPEWEVFV